MNQGFFDPSVLNQIDRTVKREGGCDQCGLYRHCKSPKMFATGKGEQGIFILAEAPGRTEDSLNVQLVGKAGKLLRGVLHDFNIDLDQDCRKMNAVNCRPTDKSGENRHPTNKEIEYCHPFIERELNEFKPDLILLMGEHAIRSFLLGRWKKNLGTGNQKSKDSGIVTKWRGWGIPDRDYNAWVVPMFHPSFAARKQEDRDADVVNLIFLQDIQYALSLLDKPFPKADEKEIIQILDSPQAIKFLRELLYEADNTTEREPIGITFDYETTGIKPHKEGHDIISCSIATDRGDCVSFLIHKDVNKCSLLRRYLVQVLQHPQILKQAHNMKYEETWSRVILGTHVEGWYWDSMLAAHILDNRSGITGLKFQAYVNFGIVDYDSHIEKYLKSKEEKCGNSFNSIRKVLGSPSLTHDLLYYNAMDSLLEHRLAEMQQKSMKENDYRAYDLFHEGTFAHADMEEEGVFLDIESAGKQTTHLTRQIEFLEEEIEGSKEGKLWKEMFGPAFKLGSGAQLGKVLQELRVKNLKQTESGVVSTDKSVLQKINSDFTKKLLERKRLLKIRDTYLDGFIREADDQGIIHPNYNLNIARTFRPSCQNPNFQNIEKHDEVAKRVCRSVLVPKQDFIWLEGDYSGLEVRIAACYHKDPVMIQYISDKTKDMHRDTAMELFLLNENEWTSQLRYIAKNNFVFAQFYGDWFQSCAENIWAAIEQYHPKTRQGTPIKDHLKSKGIQNFEAFVKHVEKVEKSFWGVRFKVYNQWRIDWYKQYLENGFFTSFTGFTFQGYMSRNDAINYPVQSAAFHCLLKSATAINKEIKDRGMLSRLMAETHDSFGAFVHPDEFDEFIAMAKDIMTVRLRKEWDWIIVPLDVEFECAPMNESWFNLKEIKLGNTCKVCGCKNNYEEKDKDNKEIKVWECPLCGEREEIVE